MAGPTVADKEAELAALNAAIAAVRLGQSYSQGDRQLTRADLDKLEASRSRCARELRELVAAAAGAKNPGVLTATWT
jgi:hypothetical protein